MTSKCGVCYLIGQAYICSLMPDINSTFQTLSEGNKLKKLSEQPWFATVKIQIVLVRSAKIQSLITLDNITKIGLVLSKLTRILNIL